MELLWPIRDLVHFPHRELIPIRLLTVIRNTFKDGATPQKILGLLVAIMCVMAPVSFLVIFPSSSQVEQPSNFWFTVAATAVGNYPGGVLGFNVFAVDSATRAGENISIDRMVVVTPWANYSQSSLPLALTPGEAYSSFINATIPSSFKGSSFSAEFVANARFWNGTVYIPFTESARVAVQVLSLPNNSPLELYIILVLVGIIAIVLAGTLYPGSK